MEVRCADSPHKERRHQQRRAIHLPPTLPSHKGCRATHSEVLGLRTSSAKLSTLILFCISRNNGVRSAETPLQQQNKNDVVAIGRCCGKRAFTFSQVAFSACGGYTRGVVSGAFRHATLPPSKQGDPWPSRGRTLVFHGLQGAPRLDVR